MSDYDERTGPDEYDHDYQNIDEDEIPDEGRSFRVVVWIVSAVIAVVMLAFPLVRIIDRGGDDNDDQRSASEARAFVAQRFAQDAFVRLSVDDAARWAVPSLRDTIVAMVAEIRETPSAELTGATITVAAVECDAGVSDDSDCFHAWIRKPGSADLFRAVLVVRIVNGDPRVVDLQQVSVV